MNLRDWFTTLPLLSQVNKYQFYIPGYTEALSLFSEVRVVMGEDWISGVPSDLQQHFYKVKFPCYFIPIFVGENCYGFVLKGFSKTTPRFCTNLLLPGCEKIKGGEIIVLVEGIKDCYIPMLACKGLPVVVIPLLTSVPSLGLLEFLRDAGCRVLYIPDSDDHVSNHKARFFELCGKAGIKSGFYELPSNGSVCAFKDYGDFFSPNLRTLVLNDAKRLRSYLQGLGGGIG